MKCIKGYNIEPLRSAAGYYMGAMDYEEGPVCRITSRYAEDAEGAKHLPLDRQDADENMFCNGCGNCFLRM